MLQLEQVLESRFPEFAPRPEILARPMLALMKRIAREDDANAFLAQCEGLEGFEFVDRMLEWFNFSYKVVGREIENIPAEGRVVIVANHPLGLLDGVALLKLVGEVRRDVRIVANDVLLQLDAMRSLMLPVANMGGGDNRENVKAIEAALGNDEAVIVFPSGEVSRAGLTGIRDPRWRGGFLRFAEATRAPLLPVRLRARNSALFYGVSTIFRPLSTLMLLREPHLQRNGTMEVRIGEPIPWKALAALDVPREEKIRRVHGAVYGMPRAKVVALRTEKTVARPEDRLRLRRELREARTLGRTGDGMQVLLFDPRPDSAVLRELGRLREIAFRRVGEGTGRRRDLDAFDAYYSHVVLWDDAQLQIAGAYRVGDVARIVAERGTAGLYTNRLFEFEEGIRPHFEQSLELGRSFVQPRYQGLRALEHLWQGIGALLATRPDVRYLFGAVSLSPLYPEDARRMVVHFYSRHFGMRERLATPRSPYAIAEAQIAALERLMPGDDCCADFRALKRELARRELSVPALYKQYTELCEPGGTRFLGFHLDTSFGDCVDGLVLVDLLRMKPGKRARYIGGACGEAVEAAELSA